ncbi:MAG: HlyC/CorC family transporter [Magnetococcales bacterium]|nr:HlyC/CorC family transporter [Magnetococcales bacterium]MBF0117047.1 HlyC/CorC family transporter [Magnetococcales bacterium]
MASPDLATSVWDTHSVEIIIRCIFQVFTLLLSAFFSASEVALFSLNRLDLNKLESQRHPYFERIQTMLREPRGLIISILCGNESVNIASSANMAALLLLFYTEQETQWINLVIMVPLLLLVGEVTPKTFAITFPVNFTTQMTARFLPGWIRIIRPVRRVVRLVADKVTTFIAGHPPAKHNILHTDEFLTLVEEGEVGGAIDPREKMLIAHMLEASETEVIQIMTPFTRMHYLDADKPMEQILEDFRTWRHPHMPVIRKHRNHIIGFLESEDIQRLLQHHTDFKRLNIDDMLRPVHFVPPNKKVDEMFDYFKNNKTWAAIVLGEYGDVFGIVTIADVLGFVFGGISQNIGTLGYKLIQSNPDVYRVSGDLNLEMFNEVSGLGINILEDESMITTLGGYVFHLLGRLPKSGDSIEEGGIRFCVTEMDGLRIKSVEVSRIALADGMEKTTQESNLASKQPDMVAGPAPVQESKLAAVAVGNPT